jgi:serine/threonine-protein kinase RCK2
MVTAQTFKNFLRHGKGGAGKSATVPHGDPTTTISSVTAHPENQRHMDHHAITEPVPPPGSTAHFDPGHNYSVGAGNNQNIAAQAGNAAAHAADGHQKKVAGSAKYDPAVLEQIVADEKQAKNKLPSYAGLERWTLIEKMGDGAFSNVYRAKDNEGELGEVAIKVVRKYELNATQVR